MNEKIILHVDMNSFFASCEQALNPELKEQPLIVGGDPKTRRGIVLAASYDAKVKGVYTTMLVHEAMRLCPEAILVKSTYGLYAEMSKKVMAIFDDFTPLKQQVSIDEAFLDMTGTEHLFGDYMSAAKLIQNRILEALDLPCSVGIAHNKLLAKMASDFKKPMGITTIFEEEIEAKLWPLKVGELHGIGKKTVPKLNEIGIKTIGDLATFNFENLKEYFGYNSALHLQSIARGESSNVVHQEVESAKSVGNELTYAEDIKNFEKISDEILLLADRVGYRLRKKMLSGKTISIKIKFNTFKVITRSKTLEAPTHHTATIYETAMTLIKKAYTGQAIRLLGVTVSNIEDEKNQQLTLFDMETVPEHSEVDHMVDEIRDKFGYGLIKRASLLNKKPSKT